MEECAAAQGVALERPGITVFRDIRGSSHLWLLPAGVQTVRQPSGGVRCLSNWNAIPRLCGFRRALACRAVHCRRSQQSVNCCRTVTMTQHTKEDLLSSVSEKDVIVWRRVASFRADNLRHKPHRDFLNRTALEPHDAGGKPAYPFDIRLKIAHLY